MRLHGPIPRAAGRDRAEPAHYRASRSQAAGGPRHGQSAARDQTAAWRLLFRRRSRSRSPGHSAGKRWQGHGLPLKAADTVVCQPEPVRRSQSGDDVAGRDCVHGQPGPGDSRHRSLTAACMFTIPEPFRLLAYLAGIMGFVGANAAYLVWVERKGAARFQRRPGPTEVGPAGLLQPIADAIKLLTKQVLVPSQSDRQLFRIAPALVMAPGLMCLATIP